MFTVMQKKYKTIYKNHSITLPKVLLKKTIFTYLRTHNKIVGGSFPVLIMWDLEIKLWL